MISTKKGLVHSNFEVRCYKWFRWYYEMLYIFVLSVACMNDLWDVNRCCTILYRLNLKITYIIFNNSVPTAKKTQYVFTVKITLLMRFKEVIAVYSENIKHKYKLWNKCRIIYC